MSNFDEALRILKSFEIKLDKLIETRIAYVRKYDNGNDNYIDSLVILDSELNQLYVVKEKDSVQFTKYLLTPQPFENFISLDVCPGYALLWGNNNVGIVEFELFRPREVCKQVAEVFSSTESILSVKWYPYSSTHFAILTKVSILIMHIHSPKNFYLAYRYTIGSKNASKSVGLFDEFVTMEFSTSKLKSSIDDACIFVLKSSGEIIRVPEISEIKEQNLISLDESINDLNDNLVLNMRFLPSASDNYLGKYLDMAVLRGSHVDIMVLLLNDGDKLVLQHTLVVGYEHICVFERIDLANTEIVYKPGKKSQYNIHVDQLAYPPRYFVFHDNGIHSVILPWVINLRHHLTQDKDQLLQVLNQSRTSIIDRELMIGSTESNNFLVAGIFVERKPMKHSVLHLFHKEKSGINLVDINLRQEIFIESDNQLDFSEKDKNNENNKVKIADSNNNEVQTSQFIKAFEEQLSQPGRLGTCINAKDQNSGDIQFILELSKQITNQVDARFSNANSVMLKRQAQLRNVCQLQLKQLSNINDNSTKLKEKADELSNKLQRVKDGIKTLEERLTQLVIQGCLKKGLCNADKLAIQEIRDLEKKIKALKASFRGCQFRINDHALKEKSIDPSEIESIEGYMDDPIKKEELTRLKPFLEAESDDIAKLIQDVEKLVKIN